MTHVLLHIGPHVWECTKWYSVTAPQYFPLYWYCRYEYEFCPFANITQKEVDTTAWNPYQGVLG